MRTRSAGRLVAFALGGAVALAACSSPADQSGAAAGSGDATADPTADVTITVGNMPPTAQEAERSAFEANVARFMEENPNIAVEPEETVYEPSTFNAMIAGGTMPTVLEIPFTEVQRIVEKKQVADVTDYISQSQVLSDLNPVLKAQGVDENGRAYAIPWNMYTIGLVYNRTLFEEAGLDPDKPPTTWDEVRDAARTITEKTGVPGFVMPSAGRNGGWMLTALNYAFGGTIQDFDGQTATTTLKTDAMKQALQFLHDIRWEDAAAGDNFLLEGGDLRNEYAAGRVGMFLGAGDAYEQVVDQRGFDGDEVGIAPLPMDQDGLGTLGGGAISVISPSAKPDQIAAGIKWVEFNRLSQYLSQDRAVAAAKARADDGLSVGAPTVPPVDDALYMKYLGWIADYINVDRDRFQAYLDSFDTLPVVAEPARGAGDIYVELDSVVQTVFTEENPDVDALLDQAQSNIDATLASN